MTETEWLTAAEPQPMQEFLGDRMSDRKWWLFYCACARRIWHLLVDERSRQAVSVRERSLEGLATEDEVTVAAEAANAAADATNDAACEADAFYSEDPSTATAATYAAADAAHSAANTACGVIEGIYRSRFAGLGPACAVACTAEAAAYAAGADDRAARMVHDSALAAESSAQVDLLRDLIGNPFQSPRLESVWLIWNSGTIPKLAQAIYDEQAFHDMPILADALEEAGCTDQAILSHLRGPGPHVRGCWVVDLLLGKT